MAKGNDGKELERIVASVQQFVHGLGWTIEQRVLKHNPAGRVVAEFDVVATDPQSGRQTLFSCRDRQLPEGSEWMYQLAGRRLLFPFDDVVAVAAGGFASTAEDAARSLNIRCVHANSEVDEPLSRWLATRGVEFLVPTVTDWAIAPLLRLPPDSTAEIQQRALESAEHALATIARPWKLLVENERFSSDELREHMFRAVGLLESLGETTAATPFTVRAASPRGEEVYGLALEGGDILLAEIVITGTIQIRRSTPSPKRILQMEESGSPDGPTRIASYQLTPAAGITMTYDFVRRVDGAIGIAVRKSSTRE